MKCFLAAMLLVVASPYCRDAPWGVSGAAMSSRVTDASPRGDNAGFQADSPPRRRPTGRLYDGTVLDDFADISRWKVLPSDGIEAAISPAEGGLRLDYDFQGRGGYAVVRREIPLDLPENYEITFRMRGEGLPNTLEFKLVDPTQENVWWVTRRDFEPPREWTEIRFKKRHIQFAWGPKGGGEIRRVAAIELTVTAGRGGKGHVIFDDLTLTERPPDRPYDRTPRITSSAKSFTMDFLERREYGGLVVRRRIS